jgi:xanthine/CO dehydrogenase XdhC/CoxF family maturation factor
MTHRYRDDLALLRTLLPGPVRYLGLLGPRKRTARLLAELAGEGFATDAAALAKLHAPVGLDLGGTTPETVALSIVSEIQARWASRGGGFLRERTGAIHG